MLLIAPSLLAADMLHLERDARRMVDAGADLLHVDVMDGHFVPNLSFGLTTVAALRARFDTELDVHLMISEPLKYAERFCDAGAGILTVHAEADGWREAVSVIRSRGVKAGVSLKPATPVDAIRDALPSLDLVLVMTVEPGFGGQKWMPAMLDKLAALRGMGYRGLLEVDGGVNADNLPTLADAGADVFVMGTALFRAVDPAGMMRRLRGTLG